MSRRPRDGAERLLRVATLGLPRARAAWGAALRAELAAIDDPQERRAFARGAASVAFRRGLGVRVGLGLVTALLVAVVTVTASRVQLPAGGPGVLPVTVPVPALLLLAVTALVTRLTRSFGVGLQSGLFALVASFAALWSALAFEGLTWMERHGVFVLDGDPPRGAASTADVLLDVFTTGLWVGHVAFWLTAVLVGAGLGALTGPAGRAASAA